MKQFDWVFSLWIAISLSSPSFSAEVMTLAGTGIDGYAGDNVLALEATLSQPFGLEIGPDGMLYFCEFSNHVVRQLDLKTGLLKTVVGTGRTPGSSGDGGLATDALLHEPHELRIDAVGNCYIADTNSQAIRRVDAKTKVITTVAGNGQPGFSGDGSAAISAQLNLPISVILDGQRGLLVCDIKNHRIRHVDFDSGLITSVAGTGERGVTPDGSPLIGTALNGPRTLTIEPRGDLVVVLREGNSVYRIDRSSMKLQHLAGTGIQGFAGDGGDAKLALLAGPKGVAIDHSGDILLCDTENHVIRVIRHSTGIIETLIGNGQAGDGPDGPPKACRLNRPHGIFVDQEGVIYIGDSGNHKVRKYVP